MPTVKRLHGNNDIHGDGGKGKGEGERERSESRDKDEGENDCKRESEGESEARARANARAGRGKSEGSARRRTWARATIIDGIVLDCSQFHRSHEAQEEFLASLLDSESHFAPK